MKKILTLLVLCAASCSPLPAQNTLAGNLTVQQAVKLTGAASPSQLTANANDYAPAGLATAAVLRLQSDVPRTITGLAGGAAGRMVWLTNVGSQTISLATESASSAAANRFAFGASDFDLPAGGGLSIWYDTMSSRWRSATNLAAGGGGTTIDQTARDAAAAAQATADSKQAALTNAATLAKVTESAGLPLWDGAAWPGGGGGGTGTVTSVSVVSANGVSGSVATASTTPAITLSLGAITPSSVAATGAVTGSNLSGINTGDQTSVTGNAGTATALQTARTINGVSFNGTAAITVPAAAGTLTGSTLASGVTASSLTSAAGGTFGTAAFTDAAAYDPAGAAAAITLSGLGGVPTSRTVNGHALSGNVTVTPSDLSLVIGTNVQAWSAKLDSVAAIASGSGWLHNDGAGALAWSTPNKSDVGLGSVENTALSTWTGSANLSTVGTISSGMWHGSALADTYIASAAAWNAKVSFPGFGTTGTTAAVGNDSRLSDARTPTAHNQAWSTITTTPTTLSGYGITDAQGLDADLTALAGLSTTGIIARTGAGTASTLTITGTTDQVTVTNGDGVSGNPTLALPQSIATTSTPQFTRLGVGVASAVGDTIIANNTDSNRVLFSGTTKGIRFTHNSTGSVMEGMDNTGSASYQPLYLGGSYVAMSISGGETARLTSSGFGVGTSVPNHKVTVGGTGIFGYGLQQADTTVASITANTLTGEVRNYSHTNCFPTFYANGVEAMRIGLDGALSMGWTASVPRIWLFKDSTASIGLGTNMSGVVPPGGAYELSMFSGGTSDSVGRISFGRRRGDTTTYTEQASIDLANGNLSAAGTLSLNGSKFFSKSSTINYAWSQTSGSFRFTNGAGTVDLVTIADGGSFRLHTYGAGTLVTDSSGNVTASSDRRLKDVGANFTRGLDDVVKIQPRFYTWKPESGMNTEDVNVGFIAQDVQDAIPEAVGTMKTSDTEEDDAENPGKKIKGTKREAAEFLTLSDRPIIAALVNAVKELKAENDDLRARVSALENRKATK